MKRTQLSKEQIAMLDMSEDDIINDQVMSQEDLYKQDLEWLKNCNFNYSIENKK